MPLTHPADVSPCEGGEKQRERPEGTWEPAGATPPPRARPLPSREKADEQPDEAPPRQPALPGSGVPPRGTSACLPACLLQPRRSAPTRPSRESTSIPVGIHKFPARGKHAATHHGSLPPGARAALLTGSRGLLIGNRPPSGSAWNVPRSNFAAINSPPSHAFAALAVHGSARTSPGTPARLPACTRPPPQPNPCLSFCQAPAPTGGAATHPPHCLTGRDLLQEQELPALMPAPHPLPCRCSHSHDRSPQKPPTDTHTHKSSTPNAASACPTPPVGPLLPLSPTSAAAF